MFKNILLVSCSRLSKDQTPQTPAVFFCFFSINHQVSTFVDRLSFTLHNTPQVYGVRWGSKHIQSLWLSRENLKERLQETGRSEVMSDQFSDQQMQRKSVVGPDAGWWDGVKAQSSHVRSHFPASLTSISLCVDKFDTFFHTCTPSNLSHRVDFCFTSSKSDRCFILYVDDANISWEESSQNTALFETPPRWTGLWAASFTVTLSQPQDDLNWESDTANMRSVSLKGFCKQQGSRWLPTGRTIHFLPTCGRICQSCSWKTS